MNHANIRIVVSVLSLLAGGACAAQPANSTNPDSRAAAAPATSSCAAPGRRLETLRASAAPADSGQLAIAWSATVPPEARRLTELVEIEGACATSVNGFAAGLAALRTGEAFAVDGKFRIEPRGEASAFLVAPEVRAEVLPGLPKARFVMASRVSYRRREGALQSDYLGLWQGDGTWIVAAFSEREDGSHGPARIILTSTAPICGLTYFPAPDTPSGRIGLVQQTGPQAVRLIGFDWDHRSFFPAT